LVAARAQTGQLQSLRSSALNSHSSRSGSGNSVASGSTHAVLELMLLDPHGCCAGPQPLAQPLQQEPAAEPPCTPPVEHVQLHVLVSAARGVPLVPG
jgi:hypothetical protein